MKRNLLLAFLVSLLAVGAMYGQAVTTATPTQQTATHADASTIVGNSSTSAATITLTPLAGQCIYVTSIEIDNTEDATGVAAAAQTNLTTTNLGGLAWKIPSGTASAGLMNPPLFLNYSPGAIKAATCGTAVTFVLPTFATHQTLNVNVTAFSAP